MKLFNKRSKASFIATVLAVAYSIYLANYLVTANAETTSDAEAIGAGFATLLILPSLMVLIVGVIFGVIGFFTRKAGLQLTAAILYAASGALFILYAPFLIPSIVLGFIGYSGQKKLNQATS